MFRVEICVSRVVGGLLILYSAILFSCVIRSMHKNTYHIQFYLAQYITYTMPWKLQTQINNTNTPTNKIKNDPNAGSPTITLLRLFLPPIRSIRGNSPARSLQLTIRISRKKRRAVCTNGRDVFSTLFLSMLTRDS